ncbi:MAG: Eco57I restriction-modification methylase domain-containing protein [Bacteroidetes bacterium]|nr:Eco57I restriction-modification methylase domain-containing protein [Bacteroidota bacterium]
MIDILDIAPFEDELPGDFADRLGTDYSASVTKSHKKQNGQFFTPTAIARFMGGLAGSPKDSVRILDPGCGTSILTCALVETLIDKAENLKAIEVTAYETDQEILPYTEKALEYLQAWLKGRSIELRYKIVSNDFILENARVFEDSRAISLFDRPQQEKFDYIISNPPYFKLSKEDPRTKASASVVSGQPNIYALFMAVASRLLADDGELIFITPRSFASGNYFRAFREFFFTNLQVNRIHLFASRKETFNRDDVLQELLIMKATPLRRNAPLPEMIVSSSHGLKDLDSSREKTYPQFQLIDLNSREKILHLPVSGAEEDVINIFRSWNHRLRDYGIEISTGPVVAFRARKFIRDRFENGKVVLAPLYWLHNVIKMSIEWPVHKIGKGQYIEICEGSEAVLIPNRNYVLLRRFSAKDDRSRLIAAPYFVNPNEPEYIGVENKLNYVYRPKGVLERSEAVGLAAILNSKLFDMYFRTFNGNVNVSATELREMPLPPLDTIKEIGNRIIQDNDFSESKVAATVAEFFNPEEVPSV